jgi:hypothetical protein
MLCYCTTTVTNGLNTHVFDDCDIFEKAIELSVNIDEENSEYIPIKDCRSRYAKFIYYNRIRYTYHAVRCDREPSRINFSESTDTCFT